MKKISTSGKIQKTLDSWKTPYWGKVPKLFQAHPNVAFKKFGRRSNWSAAASLLNLKPGASSKTLFFSVYARTVASNASLFDDIEPVTIHWSERHIAPNENPIVVEHGWLPRVCYQISPFGANARSHIRYDSNENYLEKLGASNFQICKERGKHFFRPKQVNYEGLTDQPFCLIPLQGGGDYNLRYSDSGFDHFFGQEGANDKVAQALIDRCHEESPGIRLIVTEHPAKNCRLSSTLKLPKDVSFVDASQGIRSIDLSAHPNCKGVISINSNLIHEAMLLDTPICSYGNLMYGSDDKPTFESISAMLEHGTAPLHAIEQYLAMLFLNQWELTDLMDPLMLRAMLTLKEKAVPWELRTGKQAIPLA